MNRSILRFEFTALQTRFQHSFEQIIMLTYHWYWKRGNFRWEKFRENVCKTFHVGVIFMTLGTFFCIEGSIAKEGENNPHVKISTFTVMTYVRVFSSQEFLAKMMIIMCDIVSFISCFLLFLISISRALNWDLFCLFFTVCIFSDFIGVLNSAKIKPMRKFLYIGYLLVTSGFKSDLT